MTDNAQALADIMAIISNMEQLVSANNLIAGGLITDIESIREVAAASALQIEMNLVGTKMIFDGTDSTKQLWSQMETLINQD